MEELGGKTNDKKDSTDKGAAEQRVESAILVVASLAKSALLPRHPWLLAALQSPAEPWSRPLCCFSTRGRSSRRRWKH